MSNLALSAAFSMNPMTVAIHDGRVKPEGVSWTVSAIHPSELFWRQLRFAEFDVSEMSLSSLIIAISKGSEDWVALPIFTTRRFFHTNILVRADAGIKSPSDLVGKRVGVPEYQQTAAVWTRAALTHEFGVVPTSIHWYMERAPEMSHGGATKFVVPRGVDLQYIPPDKSIGSMLASGELDAAIAYIAARNLVDRSADELKGLTSVSPLFHDGVAEGLRYYEHTGLLPVNHCVVLRKTVAQRHRWLALNVVAAFERAKAASVGSLLQGLEAYRLLGLVDDAAWRRLRTTDPLPYGLGDQERASVEAVSGYLQEQDLVTRKVDIEEVFVESTLGL